MFILFALLMFAAAMASAQNQEVTDALDLTRRYVDAGALELALTRVERLQPAAPAAPGWSDWEQLRCSLLARLGRGQALIERAAQLPADAPQALVGDCLLGAAHAAVELGQGRQARALLAQLIWKRQPAADDWRRARLLVIDSYFADGRPADAYLLILRYQQDYQPLDRAAGEHFATALLAAGMAKEAVNWLAQLDDKGPTKAWLRMRTGLLTPDAAVALARAALVRKPDAAWWRVIEQAGIINADLVLQTEALENLLDLADDGNDISALTAKLRQAYEAAAQDVANRGQLLRGDDDAWMNYAGNTAAPPSAARALYAFMVDHGGTAATRDNARAQLVLSLADSGLPLAAARLLDGVQLSNEQVDAQSRTLLAAPAARRNAVLYTLGLFAESSRDFRRAADYYLEAALTDGAKPPDALRLAARLRAVSALDRAGLRDDAHAQFEWLRRNVKDSRRPDDAESKLRQP
ncbi:MAG TPA: hypothetical protein VMT94_07370 [Burkholderiales bacterium]|nr:hypothetical protein [Burkholderiales bacterium]